MIKQGNFVIGSCWCDLSCSLGHKVRIINIERGHFGVCDECKTYIFLGSNLTSSWRNEDKDIWEKNKKELKNYNMVGG